MLQRPIESLRGHIGCVCVENSRFRSTRALKELALIKIIIKVSEHTGTWCDKPVFYIHSVLQINDQ